MRTVLGGLAWWGVVSAGVPGFSYAEPGFAEPADFAEPAHDKAWLVDQGSGGPLPPEPPRPEELAASDSTVRVGLGPVLRVSEPVTDAGLGAAVDVGTGAVGLRLAGSWVRVGSAAGLAEYRAELWVDFARGGRLHPIVGAGVGLARLAPDGAETQSYGVGVLRGSLEYVLPVVRADARAGLDLSGHVPAMHGRNVPDARPWLLVGARVGVGF